MYFKFDPPEGIVDDALLISDNLPPSKSGNSDVVDYEDWKKNGNYLRWGFSDELVSKYFPESKGFKYVTGNIYYHKKPYEVHTDTFKPTIGVNLLIPLEREEKLCFAVFDQTHGGSCVWKPGDGNIVQRGVNTIFNMRPCDTPTVKGITEHPCGFADYLPEENDFYHGLSGSLIDWKSDEGIVFPAVNLHATGIMEAPKFGLALWFSNTFDEICSALKK